MIKTVNLSLIGISTLFILVALTNASNTNDEFEEKLLQNLAFDNFSPYPILKRNIDKYRYFGGIGKRNYDIDYLNEGLNEDSSELKDRVLDKMRLIDSLGKRSFKIEKQNPLLMKKSRAGQIDKYRYLGSIGK